MPEVTRRAWLTRAAAFVSAVFGVRKAAPAIGASLAEQCHVVTNAINPHSQLRDAVMREVRYLRTVEKKSYGGSGYWREIHDYRGAHLKTPAAFYRHPNFLKENMNA